MKKKLMVASLLVSIVLTGLKFAAYFLTSSAAVLTDALESIINIVAAAFALYSLGLAAQPRDFDHPYGHGKIEFFSAGFEGALIILAGIFIVFNATGNLFHPDPIGHLPVGMLLIGVTVVANGGLGWYLQKAWSSARRR